MRMTQSQVRHPAGELPSCTVACGREPKHYEDKRAARAGGGHFLECSPCDRRTPKRETLALATADWVRMVDQPALATTAGQCAVSITSARERAHNRR